MQFNGGGVAAIVGPNGCGKSNLSDAISWVLGEQSARLLRGERMADVIFNGTRSRPPTSMAEVSITLMDPEYEQTGPIEIDSVVPDAVVVAAEAAADDGNGSGNGNGGGHDNRNGGNGTATG